MTSAPDGECDHRLHSYGFGWYPTAVLRTTRPGLRNTRLHVRTTGPARRAHGGPMVTPISPRSVKPSGARWAHPPKSPHEANPVDGLRHKKAETDRPRRSALRKPGSTSLVANALTPRDDNLLPGTWARGWPVSAPGVYRAVWEQREAIGDFSQVRFFSNNVGVECP